ncbi:hypothetical protein ACK323_04480 [Aeromonas enteropelogenes]|uniref:hypothetical protein n=1 Tax=Aeromonas TaxID=642 RepID=UPI002B307DA9|nr:hypothetical protein VAWG001_13770 [Aeromonas dhakensis]
MTIRVTVEQLTSEGWATVTKTTRVEEIKRFINLSKLADIMGLSRGKFRYRYEKD